MDLQYWQIFLSSPEAWCWCFRCGTDSEQIPQFWLLLAGDGAAPERPHQWAIEFGMPGCDIRLGTMVTVVVSSGHHGWPLHWVKIMIPMECTSHRHGHITWEQAPGWVSRAWTQSMIAHPDIRGERIDDDVVQHSSYRLLLLGWVCHLLMWGDRSRSRPTVVKCVCANSSNWGTDQERRESINYFTIDMSLDIDSQIWNVSSVLMVRPSLLW